VEDVGTVAAAMATATATLFSVVFKSEMGMTEMNGRGLRVAGGATDGASWSANPSNTGARGFPDELPILNKMW